MDKTMLMELTADIVAAHVSNNAVPAGSVGGLISAVHGALNQVGESAAPVTEVLVPAVSVRSSVKRDGVICLDCGRKLKMLKRHLNVDHGLTPAAYRERWGLAGDYPIVAPDYAEKRAELAIKIGLGRKRSVDLVQAPTSQPVTETPPAPVTKIAPRRAKARGPKSVAAKLPVQPKPDAKVTPASTAKTKAAASPTSRKAKVAATKSEPALAGGVDSPDAK